MRKLIFLPRARHDLLDIWEYIAADNVNAADRMIARIEDAIERLREFPGVGHERPDVKVPKRRFCAVRPYVIAYRYNSRSLTVVRIIHGARDFRGIP